MTKRHRVISSSQSTQTDDTLDLLLDGCSSLPESDHAALDADETATCCSSRKASMNCTSASGVPPSCVASMSGLPSCAVGAVCVTSMSDMPSCTVVAQQSQPTCTFCELLRQADEVTLITIIILIFL